VLIENGPVFIALPLYNSGHTFWKSENDLTHYFHALSIEGYDNNGFFFRNSWSTDWGNNSCGHLPFVNWSRVVEAWYQRSLVDFCQHLQNCWRISVYGNARRASVVGTVALLTEETEATQQRYCGSTTRPRRYGKRSTAVRKASIRRPIKRPQWLIARSILRRKN